MLDLWLLPSIYQNV
uniref:LRR-RLK n=1 Tax=Rhizophora mucronata TaxID=61149 RepID=A0A2P2MWP0_RHIMU